MYYLVRDAPGNKSMGLPSDDLHKSEPLSFKDFKGITIHDALIVQKAIRARADRLKNNKLKAEDELKDIDLTLSIFIAEEMRLQEPENS